MRTNMSSVNEGGGARTVKVTLAKQGLGDSAVVTATISVGQVGDSATEGVDYETVSDFTIKIPAYSAQAEGYFTLTPKDDDVIEGNERLSILGSSFYTVESKSLTIIDDDGEDDDDEDDAPSVTLSASPSKVGEGAGATSVTVTATVDDGATATTATALTIDVGKAGDRAVSGADYQAVSDFTITIPKDGKSATGTFTLTPIDDSLSEQSIVQSLSIEGSATGVDVTGTSVEIEDNDRPVTLSVSPAKVGEGAGETTVTVTAKHATGVNAPAATAVTVSVGKSADSATSGTDYSAVSDFTVTIPKDKNKGTATFKLTPTEDASIEGDEKISVSGTLTGQTVTGTAITLEDNDRHDITLSVSPTSVDEDDGATQVTVTATMASAATASTDVTVSVGKGTDSATSGTDYKAVSDFTVTIVKDAKTGTATFTLTPTDDSAYEGDEKISIAGTSTGRKVKAASVTLAEDDKPKVKLKLNPTKVTEDGGKKTVTITATLQDEVTLATKQNLTVLVGDPNDSAKSGLDYDPLTPRTISIWPGQSTGVASFDLKPKDGHGVGGPRDDHDLEQRHRRQGAEQAPDHDRGRRRADHRPVDQPGDHRRERRRGHGDGDGDDAQEEVERRRRRLLPRGRRGRRRQGHVGEHLDGFEQ